MCHILNDDWAASKPDLYTGLDGLAEIVALTGLDGIIREHREAVGNLPIKADIDQRGFPARVGGVDHEGSGTQIVELTGDAATLVHELMLPARAQVRREDHVAALYCVADTRTQHAAQRVTLVLIHA